jgi:hypothetical protein
LCSFFIGYKAINFQSIYDNGTFLSLREKTEIILETCDFFFVTPRLGRGGFVDIFRQLFLVHGDSDETLSANFFTPARLHGLPVHKVELTAALAPESLDCTHADHLCRRQRYGTGRGRRYDYGSTCYLDASSAGLTGHGAKQLGPCRVFGSYHKSREFTPILPLPW